MPARGDEHAAAQVGKAPPGMLTRGLVLLIELGGAPDGLVLSELAARVGLPLSTAHRLLSDLAALGFVEVEPASKRYTLGLRVLELAQGVSQTRTIGGRSHGPMRELTDALAETTILSVLDGTEIVYIQRVDANQTVRIDAHVGQRGPSYCTSTGKVLLAYLPAEQRRALLEQIDLVAHAPETVTDRDAVERELERVAERGWGLADREYQSDVRALAVPVLGLDGRCVASLCVAAPAFRAPERLEDWLPPLTEAADRIRLALVGPVGDDAGAG